MSEHIVPLRVYFTIFGLLMLGTVLTVGAAFIDFSAISPRLGFLNIVIALTIAVTKATLVILFFMHVRYSSRLTWVIVAAGFFWLGIMLVLTGSDYITRGWIKGVEGVANMPK